MVKLKLPDFAPIGPLMIHTDVARTANLVNGIHGRTQLLEAHLNQIKQLAQGRDLWFASFNYDFLSNGEFDPKNDSVQVGVLNEYFRVRHSSWRSSIPVFNFAGSGQLPERSDAEMGEIDPFGPQSDFAQLCNLDGSLLWYGAPYSAATFHHFSESVDETPLYRYKKRFNGIIKYNDTTFPISMKFHVRPLGGKVLYDVDKMLKDCLLNSVVIQLHPTIPIYWAKASDFNAFLQSQIRHDQLYMLTSDSQAWVKQNLDRLGRGFELQDFETVTNG